MSHEYELTISRISTSLLLGSLWCKPSMMMLDRANDRLSFGSFALAFALPGFVTRMKDFGAGFEMQERLAVFQEINFMRTLSRVAYAICFVCLSLLSMVGLTNR